MSHIAESELLSVLQPNAELLRDLETVDSRHAWLDLRGRFASAVAGGFERWISPDQANFREQLSFAMGRFDEGAGIVRFFEKAARVENGKPIRVADIGAGNGGVILALGNCKRYSAVSLDIVPNGDLIRLIRDLDVPVEPVVGSGNRLPFADEQFHIVLLLDTIEHVAKPELLGREVMRVLAPGGVCMLTTPPPSAVSASA